MATYAVRWLTTRSLLSRTRSRGCGACRRGCGVDGNDAYKLFVLTLKFWGTYFKLFVAAEFFFGRTTVRHRLKGLQLKAAEKDGEFDYLPHFPLFSLVYLFCHIFLRYLIICPFRIKKNHFRELATNSRLVYPCLCDTFDSESITFFSSAFPFPTEEPYLSAAAGRRWRSLLHVGVDAVASREEP